jgi:class 3 adenylate cyclase
VLQHRGDCILGILHLPSGQSLHADRCQDAVDLAIGLQSSMEHVLNERLTDRKDIHVAVGLDVGKVIVTRLGKKGERITAWFKRSPFQVTVRILHGPVGTDRLTAWLTP